MDTPIVTRVDPVLRKSIERSAKANDRSVSAEVRRILRQAFEPVAPGDAGTSTERAA